MTKTFNIPKKEEVGPVNQAIFEVFEETLGFVPNLHAVLAHSENGLFRFLTYQNSETSLNGMEREAINLVVSQFNDSIYCLSSHMVLGKIKGFTEEEIVDIRKGRSGDIKINTLVELTIEILKNKGNVHESKTKAFFKQGYTKENLIDLMLQISEKVVLNYLHNFTKVAVDYPLALTLEE
ncbi:alkylhydroperoxidase [Aquimarina aggregata]|uniref:Alkylhydroperoxidase n=1 Tax=Aquimarina aggregata TaxID=1642818 RepID=A0A163D5N4_9FLAO|nr:carboxymuconolactone decarboxylase family protein [Aquimarina aggregata]KZS43014.1 alkylhydroperoxidase [Aquimarina aggregata]